MADLTEYSLAEVCKRDGRDGNSLWIVYRDDVYDLTRFQYEHPGGMDIIADEAGRDATKPFDEIGHSADAKKTMQKYRIGTVEQTERKYMNGKRIVKPGEESRSCLSIVTCGLLGG